MSGGHFNYLQNSMNRVAEEVLDLIRDNYFDEVSAEVVDKIITTHGALIKASKMLQRLDWFVSGDDGEESFHRRWKEDGLQSYYLPEEIREEDKT